MNKNTKVYLEHTYTVDGMEFYKVIKLVNTLDFTIGTYLKRAQVNDAIMSAKHDIIITEDKKLK